MKIVNLDGYTVNPGDQSWEAFEKFGDVTIYERTLPNQIIERAQNAEILIINKTVITKEIIEKLPKLKYIGLQSTGYNVVDCKAARERGITVCNIPAYSTNAVAQLVFAFILNISNAVSLHSESVKRGEWSSCPDFCYWKTPLCELDGKTLGIIGYGSIGMRVSEIASAFNMNILVYTPHPKEQGAVKSLKFTTLDDVLENSDFVTCHCPLTNETNKIINEKALKKMKNTAVLINTSRGPVVDEAALYNALKNGEIAWACLDVLESEPPKADNPLYTLENCVITPHIAWAAFETRKRLMGILYDNLKAFLNGKAQNVVN